MGVTRGESNNKALWLVLSPKIDIVEEPLGVIIRGSWNEIEMTNIFAKLFAKWGIASERAKQDLMGWYHACYVFAHWDGQIQIWGGKSSQYLVQYSDLAELEASKVSVSRQRRWLLMTVNSPQSVCLMMVLKMHVSDYGCRSQHLLMFVLSDPSEIFSSDRTRRELYRSKSSGIGQFPFQRGTRRYLRLPPHGPTRAIPCSCGESSQITRSHNPSPAL